MDYIQSIFSDLRDAQNEAWVKEIFIDFMSAAKMLREKYNIISQNGAQNNYELMDELEFIGDVELYVYETFLAILLGKESGKLLYSYVVQKCILFIESSYKKNITLFDAAKNSGVSHGYLSAIFKQETGKSFSATLTECRIEKAKELLKNTNLKIYQVEECVGFSNPYYFSKVFREISGFNCKEYRDMP